MVVRALSLLLWLSLAVSVFAPDVAGKWKATGEGPNASIDNEFTFKKDGEKLTGTASGPMGEMPITNVQVEGNNISFTVGAGDMEIVHEGEISGDEMNLEVEMGGGTIKMTAKRATT